MMSSCQPRRRLILQSQCEYCKFNLWFIFCTSFLYEGEAEFNCHWPLVDLLLTEEHEKELCLQLSGSSSTHESDMEEEGLGQVSLKRISFRHSFCFVFHNISHCPDDVKHSSLIYRIG